MKNKLSIFIITLTFLISGSFSCNFSEETSNNAEGFESIDFEIEEPIVEIYYQIPSPDEMFAFIKDEGYTFRPEVLYPTENHSTFVSSKSQSLILGLYTANLAYSVSFEEYQTSGAYFAVVRKLADKIGITNIFDKALLDRIENNIHCVDSLEEISNESYFRIIDFLVEIENGKTLTLITIGGWVESLYIFTNLIADFEADKKVLQRIADQKYTLENLLKILGSLKDEYKIHNLTNELGEISTIFNKFKIVKNKTTGTAEGKKLKISGGNKIEITKEQFGELKTAIKTLRENIIAAKFGIFHLSVYNL